MGIQLQVKKGDSKKLPGQSFAAGLGWDQADASNPIDLDLWIIRNNGGTFEPICWANADWHRPDLGKNSEGNPWIATPELDVVHRGDDRTGAESTTGYDENAVLDLGKAPASVTQYQVYATYYDENGTGHTLGMATNVTFGVMQEATGNELVTRLDQDHGFDVTVLLCTIDRGPDGSWSMTSVQSGFTDDMLTVAHKLGIG
jgi:stress response protein SCP2